MRLRASTSALSRGITSITAWIYGALIMWPYSDADKWIEVKLSDHDLLIAKQLSSIYLILILLTSRVLPNIMPSSEPTSVLELKRFVLFGVIVAGIHTLYSIAFHRTLESFLVNFSFFLWLIGGPVTLGSILVDRLTSRWAKSG